MPELERGIVKSGLARLEFRYFPLEAIHPQALGSAQAAWCASEQGRFWPMHDLLFKNRTNLGRPMWDRLAGRLRLDGTRFGQCISAEVPARIRQDEEDGRRLGVNSTPTLFFGHVQADGTALIAKKIRGYASLDETDQTLRELLGT